jgi:signal transduction histidine kinase
VELAGFRIVQECLTNVHRHSDSPTAKVRLERQDHRMLFEVSDTGKGFQSAGGKHAKPEDHGIGLRGMRERIRQLGGTLEIDSSPAGTSVRAFLPLGQDAS